MVLVKRGRNPEKSRKPYNDSRGRGDGPEHEACALSELVPGDALVAVPAKVLTSPLDRK